MEPWLKAALDYLPQWLAYQMRVQEPPGCAMAVAYKGKVVLEWAHGYAHVARRETLTPRHRFRVASHSKSFTAAGIMKLREQGRLQLDDPAGRHVDGLHPDVAAATLAQLLSHSAGTTRDGVDAGQWSGRRGFLNERELRKALAEAPVLPANTRFKYSNHGFALLGLVIEAVTGEPFRDWITREVIDAAGLKETLPDGPPPRGTPFAMGHSGRLPLGRPVVMPNDGTTHAMAPAGGVVSTAADLARYFAQLDPTAPRSFLSAASRREMARRHWRNPHATLESYYGLGVMTGSIAGWDFVGHAGGFPGCLSRTSTLPGRDLTVSVIVNALDGYANVWSDNAVGILRSFATRGNAAAQTRPWTGRWWSHWGALDLVPMGERVLGAAPVLLNPFLDATEIEVLGRDQGRIALAHGYGSHGEAARLVRGKGGRATQLWLGGNRFVPEARAVAELKRRFGR